MKNAQNSALGAQHSATYPRPLASGPWPLPKIDFVLAGVGGQGIVLMSDLLAETGVAAGFDVKKSDVFGMAQRGGSVVSYVRLADQVRSPLPRAGDVEVLVALEKLEAARWASHLRAGGLAVVADHSLFPLSVSAGADVYPSDDRVLASLRERTERVHLVDGVSLVATLGNPRVLNVAILGFVAASLPIPWEKWLETIERRMPARYRALNVRALELGRELSSSRGQS